MAGTSYTRQSTITDGNLITASIFNNEYNQLLNAFAYATSSTTGHQHDGSAGQGGNIAKIGDQDFKNKVVISATNNRVEFYSEVSNSPVEQVRIQDGLITPVTDSDVDLGTTSVRFKDAFVDSVTITNNIVVGGTVDGRDVATDGTKLDGIEASATADQTNAEIRTAVEAATDSNVFTDADHTKLNAIEASADVTDTANVTAAGALMDSEVTNLAQVKAFDSSDYATAAQGTLAANALPKAGGAMTGAITTNSTFDGRDVATDGTKLDGIEASADVTDATNVTAAGALMDSEVTNLAQVKAFDSTDYATSAQGTLAAAALPKSGGAMTGAITTNSTFDGVDIATRDGVLTTTTNTANAALPKSGGAMTGAITTNSTFDGVDIATRDGVLTTTTNTANAALPKSGGAMTGAITTNSTFDGVDIATRDGVLSSTTTTANAALPKAGGTMSGAIAMGTSKITGAGNPTAAQDVATKAYVDANAGGEGGTETLQQTLTIGNTTTTDTKIQFRDTGIYINSSADGQLDIVADTEIQIAATTVDLNGVLDVSGNIVVAGTVDGVDIATRDGVLSSTTTTAGAALPKSGGAMTGAITTNSTFDGVDIATRDGVLTTTTNTANAALPKAGGAMTGAITITTADNAAQITLISTDADASVGPLIDLTRDSASPAANDTLGRVRFRGEDANGDVTAYAQITGQISSTSAGAVDGQITFQTMRAGTQKISLNLNATEAVFNESSEDYDFRVESNGDTHALFVEASSGNVGVGTSSPATLLDVDGILTTNALVVEGGITEDAVTLTGTSTTIDISAATNFVHDLTGATTYTFSNPASTGNASSFTLTIIQGATARTITWPSTVRWAGGTAPTLSTANNAVDVFTFYTIDGGTNYYGFTAGQAMA